MERILELYARAYDARFPVLCYDERPCFLIGELIKGIEMKAEQVKKEHYAYEKLGSCSLLATIEPLTDRAHCGRFRPTQKDRICAAFSKSGGKL